MTDVCTTLKLQLWIVTHHVPSVGMRVKPYSTSSYRIKMYLQKVTEMERL